MLVAVKSMSRDGRKTVSKAHIAMSDPNQSTQSEGASFARPRRSFPVLRSSQAVLDKAVIPRVPNTDKATRSAVNDSKVDSFDPQS